jgi:hypothetical protein
MRQKKEPARPLPGCKAAGGNNSNTWGNASAYVHLSSSRRAAPRLHPEGAERRVGGGVPRRVHREHHQPIKSNPTQKEKSSERRTEISEKWLVTDN